CIRERLEFLPVRSLFLLTTQIKHRIFWLITGKSVWELDLRKLLCTLSEMPMAAFLFKKVPMIMVAPQ
ncbi:hypothetical protein NL435_27590, partial [Klebsiella pneumoniae]|nr:hypothetical protein [Klebsiella pneumoniae]